MTKQRRTFTPEFKREAACLVLDQGYSHTEAARSLGLVESALRRWVNQLRKRPGITPCVIKSVATYAAATGRFHSPAESAAA